MKLVLKQFPYLLIAILLVVVFLQRECNKPKPCPEQPAPEVTHDTTVKHDTIRFHDTIWYPEPVSSHDSFPVQPVDSSKALKDYYAYKTFDRLIKDDSTAKMNLVISLWKNSIEYAELRGTVFQKEKVIIETHTIYKPKIVPEPPRTKVYAGFTTGAMLPDKFIFAPSLAVNTKRDHLYSVGYDPVNKMPYVAFFWKISLSRHHD